MSRLSNLEWHFVDYPDTSFEDGCSDDVLIKTTDGDLMIGCWDDRRKVWCDLGRDGDWFGSGVACWAYILGVPDTTKQMPLKKDLEKHGKVRPYPEREEFIR